MAEANPLPSLMDLSISAPVVRRVRPNGKRHWKKKERVAKKLQDEAQRESAKAEISQDSDEEAVSDVLEETSNYVALLSEDDESKGDVIESREVTLKPDETQMSSGSADFSVLDKTEGEHLSRKMIKILRWDLPKSGLSYRIEDGSTMVDALAAHLGTSKNLVAMATDPVYGRGKRRMVLLEAGTRIAATGGQGFPVKSVPGHIRIDIEQAKSMSVLVHETSAVDEIKVSGSLKSMDRETGVNFTVGQRGGYRKQASHIIKLDLVKAIARGYTFFQNEYTKIVYGMGSWDSNVNWWTGEMHLNLDGVPEERLAVIEKCS